MLIIVTSDQLEPWCSQVVGRNWAGMPDNPCRVKRIPSPIPAKRWYLQPAIIAMMGGLLPFGSIFIEMYFVFTSFWNYKVAPALRLPRATYASMAVYNWCAGSCSSGTGGVAVRTPVIGQAAVREAAAQRAAGSGCSCSHLGDSCPRWAGAPLMGLPAGHRPQAGGVMCAFAHWPSDRASCWGHTCTQPPSLLRPCRSGAIWLDSCPRPSTQSVSVQPA